MKPAPPCVLTINGGSSSIRFAVYEACETLLLRLDGKIDRIGLSDTNLVVNDPAGKPQVPLRPATTDHGTAVRYLLDWLVAQQVFPSVKAVGHRVMQGMTHSEPERVTPELLDELNRIVPYDPDHLPLEIELIEAFRQRQPTLPQVACYDTVFHRTMPRVATLLPIPRRYEAAGVRRYGFHGLSYEFLMEELARLGDPAATKGRVILSHLGNGASLAAVRDSKSIDTSMGFTPTAGSVMSSRSGELDPGLVSYLARTEQMMATQFQEMVNHASGLLGISEISSDLRDLLARESDDVRAAEAVALFCYQAKKWIGAFAAVLAGLDTLVFAGGIGENAPLVRERICNDLSYLGIELNEARNTKSASLISTDGGRVDISKDEERTRLKQRRDDPLSQWKSSPIDAVAVKHWEDYSAARNEMLARTHTMVAPWTVVRADDKPQARINLIRDLLTRLEFKGKDRQGDLPDPDVVFSFHQEATSNGLLAK